MNYKKKKLIFSIFIIITIQVILLINNKQKTTFRYFIWNIQDVSIGKLIFISFISGVLMSSILNKTSNSNTKTNPINETDGKNTDEIGYSTIREDKNETYEMTPERDLRDTQPTISVNYRVIKNNGTNELKERNASLNKSQYEDDWSNNDSEW